MRLLLAALFVFVGLLTAVALSSKVHPLPPSSDAIITVTLFFILVILAGRIFNRRGPKILEKVTFDSEKITRYRSDGRIETIRWDDLEEVGILTTSDGPWTDDLFWILVGKDRQAGCAIPSEAEGMKELFSRLQQLPDFDNMTAIQAMGSTTEAKFVCWKKGDIKPSIKAE